MNPSARIILALDVPGAAAAHALLDPLLGHVGMVKVGLELFIASGPALVKELAANVPVMLDLKLHDIPETVARAVERAGDLGVRFATLHVQQKETLERALRAAEPSGMQLLCVTVLTSMSDSDCQDLELRHPWPQARAWHLARFAHSCGLRGFVCSPKEVRALKRDCADSTFVVPGIRPAGSAVGDQKRTGTPKQATEDGADYIVVGRPIRDAADPVAAADAIAREISAPVT